MSDKKDFNGYPLFNEIEDTALRRRNQAVIMANILEDGFVQGKIKAKSALLIMGYMAEIPDEEKEVVRIEFIKQANDRGFALQ